MYNVSGVECSISNGAERPLSGLQGEGSMTKQQKGPGRAARGIYNRIIKRLLDLLIAVLALILLSPLLLITAAAVKLSSKGPVIFKQRRLGRLL